MILSLTFVNVQGVHEIFCTGYLEKFNPFEIRHFSVIGGECKYSVQRRLWKIICEAEKSNFAAKQ